MPHATDVANEGGAENRTDADNGEEAQGGPDDFEQFLGELNTSDVLEKLNALQGPLEGDLEKAETAIDYADISDLSDEDDDLPEEVPRTTTATTAPASTVENALGDELGEFLRDATTGKDEQDTQYEEDDLDDLFGDEPSSPPAGASAAPIDENAQSQAVTSKPTLQLDTEMSGLADGESLVETAQEDIPPDDDGEDAEGFEEQLKLFERSRLRMQNQEEGDTEMDELELEEAFAKVCEIFPDFEPDQTPRFAQLLQPAMTWWSPNKKTTQRPPKPIAPTKANLELAQDQSKLFKSSVSQKQRPLGAEAFMFAVPTRIKSDEENAEHMEDFIFSDEESEILPGGVTMDDLRLICTRWCELEPKKRKAEGEPAQADDAPFYFESEDDFASRDELDGHKRRKLDNPNDFLAITHYDVPAFRDPQKAAALTSRHIDIDMNDPHLLLDVNDTPVVQAPVKPLVTANRTETDGNIKKRFHQRYNISNDEAYDMLKENHSRKIRSTLGHVALEHSLPAIRLQWPYYKTSLEKRDLRAFHRNFMKFSPHMAIRFSKPTHIKKKHVKGRDAKTLFPDTKSLGLNDNSHVLLIEHSEEAPIMLSNFGMASKLFNYYRRTGPDDTTRPKGEIGEAAVLLPQDKGPFSAFGHIDPGETTPAVSNAMYRAPVFRHEPKQTDFIVSRSRTGVHGDHWYIRNAENLYVAGQQFPSVEVPGPHSRKVTTAAKNRLKMIAYRRIKRNKNNRIGVAEVTHHFPGTTDMQNRQKMKEFMQFSKEHKEWEMRPGEPIPGEDVLQTYVKPEDVCLLEAMQVGQQRLHDEGYTRDEEIEEEEEEEDGKDAKKQSFEQQMAPWNITKNFIHATQGKAMLELHGQGDPTGRGQAFSFIKTSMKGGFRALGESVEDKLDAQRLKELGGHSYNVAAQQRQYDDSIRRIWDTQKASLSRAEEPDYDMEDNLEQDDLPYDVSTPAYDAPTPASFTRRDDDLASQRSHRSIDTNGQSDRSFLRITRRIRIAGRIESKSEDITDPRVIKMYKTIKLEEETANLALTDLKPTGNAEVDARAQKRLQMELERLRKNKERRHAREKQKGIISADSPGPDTPGGGVKQTVRKCANCGQIGHIKTNKKLCPMLNGTIKNDDPLGDNSFSMGSPSVAPSMM